MQYAHGELCSDQSRSCSHRKTNLKVYNTVLSLIHNIICHLPNSIIDCEHVIYKIYKQKFVFINHFCFCFQQSLQSSADSNIAFRIKLCIYGYKYGYDTVNNTVTIAYPYYVVFSSNFELPLNFYIGKSNSTKLCYYVTRLNY